MEAARKTGLDFAGGGIELDFHCVAPRRTPQRVVRSLVALVPKLSLTELLLKPTLRSHSPGSLCLMLMEELLLE